MVSLEVNNVRKIEREIENTSTSAEMSCEIRVSYRQIKNKISKQRKRTELCE